MRQAISTDVCKRYAGEKERHKDVFQQMRDRAGVLTVSGQLSGNHRMTFVVESPLAA